MVREIKGNELSVKTKHLLVTVLTIAAIVVLGASFTFYNYREKFDIYNILAMRNAEQGMDNISNGSLTYYASLDAQECDDSNCKVKVGVANAIYEKDEQSCNGDALCSAHYYREMALSNEDPNYCEKIDYPEIRDNCYYTLYMVTNDKDLCNKIQSKFLKEICLS